MQRNKAFKRGRLRGRALPILLAGMTGYLIGGWHPAALRSSTDPSAAELVALRFPQQWNSASPAADTAALAALAATKVPASAPSNTQLALFSPEPMVPQLGPQAGAEAAEDVGSSSAAETGAPPQISPALAAAARPASTAKAPATAAAAVRRRVVDRPGHMLNDAQIASIKERLHLTPDQEAMWPAVEAALRNMAYTHIAQAPARAASSDGTELAAVDPDAVQGLKSAAVPLIMSFNAEQKEEVRNLAHVMGLDQFAAQF